MRRWILRLILVVVLLVVAALVAVHIVLQTDIPRRLVLSALHENTGLRFEAASLTTGWRGRTVLHDLSIALPLERDPFLTVPALQITHTDLLRLAIFRDIDIDEAIIERPHIILRQDTAGAWNIARAAAIVEYVQMQRAPSGPARTINLPTLSVREAILDIYPAPAGRPFANVISYGPIDIEGQPISPLAWEFEAMLDRERIARGDVSPRGRWPHRLEIMVEQAAPILDPWHEELTAVAGTTQFNNELQGLPRDLSIAASWEGQLTEDGVTGRLSLDRFVAWEMTARGAATITSTAGPTLVVEPHNLRLDNAHPDLETLHLVSGRITHSGADDRIRLVRLMVESPFAHAQIDGEWDGRAERGSANVRWAGRIDQWLADHEGGLALTINVPSVGRAMLDATLVTQGSVPQGSWDADLRFSGFGATWNDLTGRISAPRLDFITDENEYDFSGFAARFNYGARDERVVRLTHLDLPSAPPPAGAPAATFRGRGSFDIDTLAWMVDLTAANWIPPAKIHQVDIAPFDFRLQAHGLPGGREILLDALDVRMQEGDFSLTGRYVLGDPKAPFNARATIAMAVPDESETLTGRISGDLSVSGYIEPMNLEVEGTVRATDLVWEGRSIDEFVMQLRGKLDQTGAMIESDEFAILGGWWRLEGAFDHESNNTALRFAGREADIGAVLALLGQDIDVGGIVSADVRVAVPQLDFSRAELTGSWTASNLHAMELRASTGQGAIHIDSPRGSARVTDMLLEHEGGELRGSAVMDLMDLRTVAVDLTMQDWPIEIDAIDVYAHASGEAALDLDLFELGAIGDVTIVGESFLAGLPLAQFELDASILGQVLSIHNVAARMLGGEGFGAGTLVLAENRWMESTLDFAWHDVNLSLLAEYSERFAPLEGMSSGSLSARSADEQRPPEPIRIDVRATLRDARYEAVDIETATIQAYLGPQRLMIQQASAAIADGDVNLWGRVTRHEGVPFAHLHVSLDRVDLQQVATFLELTDDPMPGRVSGWASAGGYLVEPRLQVIRTVEGEQTERMVGPRLFGQGNFTLVESDLVAMPGFAQLYDVLRIDFGRPDSTGYGEAAIRLEDNALEISRLSYFNRGTDIVARLRIDNIWQGADSPISGVAAGVLRPLRDLELPLIARLDRLIGAIQTDTASVRIGGTLADYDARVVPFGEITGALSRILGGSIAD